MNKLDYISFCTMPEGSYLYAKIGDKESYCIGTLKFLGSVPYFLNLGGCIKRERWIITEYENYRIISKGEAMIKILEG
jgi:hypothetical protein